MQDKWKDKPPAVERIGNKISIKPNAQAVDMAALFAKASPTNKDVMTVLKAIYERG
jgi:hypothetical protein